MHAEKGMMTQKDTYKKRTMTKNDAYIKRNNDKEGYTQKNEQ